MIPIKGYENYLVTEQGKLLILKLVAHLNLVLPPMVIVELVCAKTVKPKQYIYIA